MTSWEKRGFHEVYVDSFEEGALHLYAGKFGPNAPAYKARCRHCYKFFMVPVRNLLHRYATKRLPSPMSDRFLPRPACSVCWRDPSVCSQYLGLDVSLPVRGLGKDSGEFLSTANQLKQRSQSIWMRDLIGCRVVFESVRDDGRIVRDGGSVVSFTNYAITVLSSDDVTRLLLLHKTCGDDVADAFMTTFARVYKTSTLVRGSVQVVDGPTNKPFVEWLGDLSRSLNLRPGPGHQGTAEETPVDPTRRDEDGDQRTTLPVTGEKG